MQDLLAHLQAEQQWTILMVTHDIPEAARLSDRILVLADGTIGTIVDVDRTDNRTAVARGVALTSRA